MARYKGKDGAVEADGSELGEIESFDVELSSNDLEANVMGSDWTDVESGQKSASGSIAVLTDPSDPGQALLIEGDVVALTLYPTSETTGLLSLSGNAKISSVGMSASVGDLVKTSYNFRNKGAWSRGTVA